MVNFQPIITLFNGRTSGIHTTDEEAIVSVHEKEKLYYLEKLMELFNLESLPKLKFLKLYFLSQLKEVGVGTSC